MKLDPQTLPWYTDKHKQPHENLSDAIQTYKHAVGLQKLDPIPEHILIKLLKMDILLLKTWDKTTGPPKLEAFRGYLTQNDQAMQHHPAWLPFALQMAVTEEENAFYRVFPVNLLTSAPSIKAHFLLSQGLSEPKLPPRLPGSDRLLGMWELTSMSPSMSHAKGRLLFAGGGWFSAQVTALGGAFHFVYSGRWHLDLDAGKLHHLCLSNSPHACFETLEASEVFGSVVPETGARCGYGGVRTRCVVFRDDGSLELSTPTGQVLTWIKISGDEEGSFTPKSGGRWSCASGRESTISDRTSE